MNKTPKTEAYPAAYLEDMGAGLRYTDWILSFFDPWINGDVCEVGAGSGNVSLDIIKRAPSSLTLFEPDNGLYKILESKISETDILKRSNCTLDQMEDDLSLQNAFIYINVLEHIKDDIGELERMYRLLKPGGAALIFVPALPFLYSQYDQEVGHWRRYTKPELTEKMTQAGFQLKTIRYFDFPGIFAWLLACKILKLRPASGNMSVYDKLVVPPSRMIENLIPPMIGKNLIAIGIKPES